MLGDGAAGVTVAFTLDTTPHVPSAFPANRSGRMEKCRFRGRWVFFGFHGFLNVIGLMPLAGSLWFIAQRRRDILNYWPLWSPWLALFTFHALVYAEPRYLLPSRPLLCIMSALALTQYLNSRKSANIERSQDDLVAVGRGWAADGSSGIREVRGLRVKV